MCVCACMRAHTCRMWSTNRSQRITCDVYFSPSTVWVSRLKTGSSGLAASAFLRGACSPSFSIVFLKKVKMSTLPTTMPNTGGFVLLGCKPPGGRTPSTHPPTNPIRKWSDRPLCGSGSYWASSHADVIPCWFCSLSNKRRKNGASQI